MISVVKRVLSDAIFVVVGQVPRGLEFNEQGFLIRSKVMNEP